MSTDRKLEPDQGSVTPLIIGMVLILLVLGFGVTAAGSAFLAGQRLQALCDGAAAAAGDEIPRGGDPYAAAEKYLSSHGSDTRASVTIDGDRAVLACDTDASIAFGALFGHPTLPRHATSASLPGYRG